MKQENKNRKQGKLSKLLIKNYVIFTLVLLLTVISIYSLAMWKINSALPFYDPSELIDKLEDTTDSDFSKIKAAKYVGKRGGLMLFDEFGNRLFSNENNFHSNFSKSEIECIPNYSNPNYYTMSEFSDKEGKTNILLTNNIITPDAQNVSKIESYVVLNKDLFIIAGDLFPERTFFTKKELKLLTGDFDDNFWIYKYDFKDKEGKERTLVMLLEKTSVKDYNAAYSLWNNSIWIFIPFYIAAAALCTHLLSKKLKGFFTPLNSAIIALENGKEHNLSCYEGPDELVEIADNFQAMSQKLKESEMERIRLDESKTKLLADISHDLKTPITVINGYTKALRDKVVPKEQEDKYLDTILKKSEKLSMLINDFHEYSKLQHPEMPIKLEKTDIYSFLQVFLADKYEELELAGFFVEAEIPEHQAMCKIDTALLQRAFENLVNNSIKYNKSGTTIRVEAKETDEKIIIDIGDDGEGISNEKLDVIFMPFVTGDEARTTEHGSGLGLAITQKIVLAHKGTISIKGDCVKGTVFEITLPKA